MLQRARRGGIRPISIGRALLRQLDTQNGDRDGDGALSPNYVITLHPDDDAKITAFRPALLDELHQAVIHHAAIEGYKLSGKVDIKIDTAESVKRGSCTVAVGSQPASELPPPTSIPSARAESPATIDSAKAFIVLGNGERIPLTGELAIVGRQSDCQILLDDNNVSRIHAEIRRTKEGWVVTDRGSTNGSMVNGQKVTEGRLLVNGDTVAFGSATVQFENS